MSHPPHIVEIQAWEVVVPTKPGAVDSPSMDSPLNGIPWDDQPIVLIEVKFSDGVSGLGEISRGWRIKDLEPTLRSVVGQAVSGLAMIDLYARTGLRPQSLFQTMMPQPAWACQGPLGPALEMAVLDAAGKRLGCRVVDLLGGAVRERVPVDYWCSRQVPQDLERTVARAVEMGFTGLKMKSRAGDPVIEQLQAVRRVAGEQFRVTIDPMFQWHTPTHVMHLLRKLEDLGQPIKLEDPFPQDQPQFWHRLRQTCTITLAWHARNLASLRLGLEHRCADGFNVFGGFGEFLTLAHTMEVLGYPCWHGSSIGMGVSQVAHMHAVAAAPACVWPSDVVSGLIRQETLIQWDWPYQEGHLPLPTGPGLGVDLDRQAIKRFARTQGVFQAKIA